MNRIALFALLCATQLAAQAVPASQPPDLIFLHGDIYTGAEEGMGGAPAKVYPRVNALAVRDGRIVAIGSNQQIEALKGPNTQVVDLLNSFTMPGFNDAHTHLAGGGFGKLNVDLEGVKSVDEMKQRIAARVRTANPGEWIVGRGWDHTVWPGQKLPTRQDLDQVTGDHPAVFVRVDGHIAVVSSAALRFAGVTRETPIPQGGGIDRDAQGELTGILRENARSLVESKVPSPSAAQRRRAAELALEDAARWGVTSIQDLSEVQNDFAWDEFLVYEQLEREGKLTLRITEWLDFNASLDVLRQQRAHHPASDPLLHAGMLKGFMDGSLGSRTAAMLQPYSDEPGNTGIPRYKQFELDKMTQERAAAGFQIGFHAIGDHGVEMALQAFEKAERELGSKAKNLRFRVEHAQVLAPDHFLRFRQSALIASVQPSHLLTDMNWAVERLGSERSRRSYAWAEFLKNNVPLAFGTDYPVEPITPFRGLYAAVTRKNEAGTKEYFPEQKISIDQAIAAYTTGSAYAEFAENQKGKLLPGMLADFVVLDRDIARIPASEILATRVIRTVVGGRTVYLAEGH